jgi:hypothetical protein
MMGAVDYNNERVVHIDYLGLKKLRTEMAL